MKNQLTLILLTIVWISFIGCSDDDVLQPANSTPNVSDQVFSIAEDAGIGSSIGAVNATDADGDSLTFQILSGNTDYTFRIGSQSGELILEKVLDYESIESFALLVQVSDEESNAEAMITINVTPREVTISTPPFPGSSFFDGQLTDADYWSDQPEILSAGMGFADIIGIEVDEITEQLVESIGGAWASNLSCGDNGTRTLTNTRSTMEQGYIIRNPYADDFKDDAIGLDALPMVLTWPVRTNTLDLSDFRLTVSNGDIVTPSAVGSFPNVEINERNVIVLYGEFGNKKPSTDPEARYVTRVDIVGEVILIGPNGQEFNAQGLFKESFSSPYDENNGPRLVGAKLNYTDPNIADGFSITLPVNPQANDEYALYGDIIAQAEAEGDVAGRLRVLTSGGFSPNGIQGVLPTDYEKFFRVHVNGANGTTVMMEEENVEYEVQGGTLKVVGLSDLGAREGVNGTVYDDCYAEDGDNYIDIILVGDDAALRNITHVEVPSLANGYSAFYNPGGPGPTPYPDASYTAPGPADLEPVILALDNPMRTSN